MKLSEILGWGEKKSLSVYPSVQIERNREWNTALTSCDREIDREALTKQISEDIYIFSSKDIAVRIISTMPTWLKPIERK